jgi:NADH-quinone oxidoreductase subunit L
MNHELFLIPFFPLAGFFILALIGKRLPKNTIALIGAGSVTIAAFITIVIGIDFLRAGHGNGGYVQELWRWFTVNDFSVRFGLRLDALSLVFVFIITFVGALIHIYSTAFMRNDRDYARFFACMNLFVFSMLILVLADNLLVLFLGWEGVGLCSYLLIGFWYDQTANANAAKKAFIVTRIGDTAMTLGLFLLFKELGTLNMYDIALQAPAKFAANSGNITLIALLLLAGGIGKSAQLPLQTWLPDAMAGPSPVSALIHAATMVTAGVYLVARMHVLFQLSPVAMTVTAIIGAVTLFIAGFSALTQTDIKRVLAYSTMSQIGYMFLALGVGAWSAAIFHFFTHAFFKALLFLAAGAIIESLHHEHNIFKMGGLKNKMPVVFYTFLIGGAALAALPLVTAGFYSKDAIIWFSFSASRGNTLLWLVALIGAFITALYTTRLMLLVFWGEEKTHVSEYPPVLMVVPLVVLAFFSVVAGFIEWPHNLVHLTLFSNLLQHVLPATILKNALPSEFLFQAVAVVVDLAAVYAGYLIYYRKVAWTAALQQSPFIIGLKRFFYSGWGFDSLYNFLFVRPFVWIAAKSKGDVFDKIYNGLAQANLSLNRIFSFSQNGSLRWYVAGFVAGLIFILTYQLISS